MEEYSMRENYSNRIYTMWTNTIFKKKLKIQQNKNNQYETNVFRVVLKIEQKNYNSQKSNTLL